MYRAGKASKKYKIRLDLTRKRLSTLINANKSLDGRSNAYVFADINFRLCLKLGERLHFFDNEQELDKLLREKSVNYDKGKTSLLEDEDA